MNKTIIPAILSSWTLLLCCTTDAISASNAVPWQLIAISDCIAKGTLHVPVDELQSAVKMKPQNQHDSRRIELKIDGALLLKGSTSTNDLRVRYFCAVPERDDYLKPNDVVSLDSQQVLVFLDWQEESREWGNWSKGFSLHFSSKSIQPYSVGLENYILNEIKEQTDALKTFDAKFQPEKEILYPRVKALVEKLVLKETATDAYRELNILGTNAIPSVVLLLDDRRSTEHLIYKTKSGVKFDFPSRPMMDLLDTFLNCTTREHHYRSLRGEEARSRVLEFWRLYLYYLRSKST